MSALPDLIEQLGKITFCASLTGQALAKMAAVVRGTDYADGQVIMLQGQVGMPAFMVVQGCVRTFRVNLDGREQTMAVLHPGDSFNIPAALLPDQATPAGAVAVGPTRLLHIAPADLQRLIAESPEIALALLRDMAGKLIHLTNLVHDLSLRPVRGRLARFLLDQAQSGTAPRWTHDQIAAQIGTVREVVSRTLRTFVQEGLIEFHRQQLIIRDPQALRREAEL